MNAPPSSRDSANKPSDAGSVRRPATRLAAIFFYLGLLWLAVLGFASAWPDMEAGVFDNATVLVADEALRDLACPWLISQGEESAIHARFDNDADRPTSFLVRTRITEGFVTLVREETRQVSLAPGASETLTWPISASDAAYGRFVMARVLAMRGPGSPARQASCGILVLGPVGIPGRVIAFAAILLGLALTGGGAIAWWRPRMPLNEGHRMTAGRAGLLAAVVLASLVTGLAGAWIPSHLLSIAAFGLVIGLLQAVYGDSVWRR